MLSAFNNPSSPIRKAQQFRVLLRDITLISTTEQKEGALTEWRGNCSA